MEHRYNYFQQNPNSLVNGQSTFNRSFMDGTQSTNNYSGSISSTSSQDQSLFRERNYTNPNAVPLMNSHSYQMDSSNQPPHSSGPPRTNAKGIYENSQSSISNVQNLAQSNSENYPNSPDFQLQPHLTSLLPQQSKSVPEFYPVEKYNTNRGSIAANMNINYFSSNKSYPEPKIIEYDIEETSTDSSPQHTSSLYSESTDQDSESIHANNVLSKQNTEYLATYDSKTTSFNKQFPAPIQFADLSLKSNSNDDHQHSILHSAYNQSDDDIIEDIPLSDNTNENEIDSKLENQEIPILRNNEQSFNTIKIQKFDYYGNKNDFGQTEFNYENKLGEPSNLSIKNNQPPYSVMNSNVQNNTPYLSQSNTLTQSHSLDYSTSETLQHKSIFPYSNTNVFNYQPKPPSVQNFNDGLKSGNYNQQNKSINHIFQSSNDSSVNSKLQSNNINSNTQDKIILNHSTSQAQVLNDQNSCQSINSSANVYNQHDLQSKEFISQQSINSSSKSSATELLSNSQQSTTYSSLLASTQSIPITSSVKVESSVSSSSAFEAIVQESQNTPYQMSKDQTLYNLPIDNTTNSLNLNQDFPNTVKPEIDIKLSQSSSNNLNENNQDTIINQSNSINKQLEENQQNSVLLPSPTIEHFTQSSNFFNSKNNTVQQDTNFQQSSRNKFTSQQAFFNDDIKSLSDQFPNNSNSSVSHSISNQNITLSQPLTTTGHSTSHYFNSVNTNNQSVFNQQPLTVKSNNQQQNIPTQDDIKPIVSSFQFLDKSNIHNTPVNLLSSIHQSPLIKTEMDLTENCIVDSNALPKETTTLTSTVTSQNVESLLTQSKNINDDLKQNNEDMSNSSQASNNIPNDQFSNMTIDNQMHNQTFNQEQNIPSYLLKTKSLDKEENPTVLQNTFSTIHDTSNPKSELLNTNNSIQSSTNKQINPLDLNQSTAYESSPLSINSQTLPTEKSIVQPLKNTFSSEQFNNKETSNAVSLGTNQSSPQLFSNQLKSHAISSPSTSTNQCLTQSFNNHNLSTSNVVSPVSSFDNQLPVQVYKSQLKSDTVSSNQSVPNVTLPSSSVAHQFPSQMFSNQPNSGSMQPTSFALNQYSSKLFNNQSTQNTIPVSSPITNQFQSQMFNTQAKPDTLSPLQPAASEYPIQSFSNQSNQNTVSSVTSVGNQLPSQVFSNQSKPGVMSSLQPATNPCPGQLFDNQPTVNSNPQVSFSASQLSSQTLDNQHNLVASSFQTIPNQYPSQPFNNQSRPNIVPPIPSSTKLPPMMLGNEIKSDVPRLQSTINQYPSQPFNTHPTSSLVPPVLSTTKLPPQIYSNQPKSDVPTPLPTSSQYSLQPTSNTPSVPLVTNQFSSEFSNQYKPNNLPFQSTPNQYLSQSSNNQLRQNIIPPLSTENQLPPQKLSIQPSVDIGLSNKPMANRYPSQPINNQPLPGFPPVQQTTNKYPSQQFNNQPGQQQVPPPQNKKFYNQTYPTQPTHNQWPTHSNVNQMSQQLSTPVSAANFSNQVNPMFTQPTLNPSSNLTTFPPNVNQQTQRLGSQVLAPNSISSNSYYNQAQGNTNVQQSQPSKIFSDQNVQLPLKGYPQQSNNMGYSNQINYQQSNAVYGQQDPYRPEQNSVVQQGFSKTWGYDNVDLLKLRDILPGDGVQPPEIKLPQGYANCDNCSPDIFRCTLNKFPSSKNLLDKSRLPLGILIHPYKDLSRLTVIQCETITRCRNCRSYINPFVQFVDNAHWKCNLCYRVNELPGEFQIDPYTKTLGDPSRRPEIQNATIEYIASQDYMVRPPQPALYLFLLDVSRTATLTGYLEIVCDRILNKIMTDDIPGDSRTNIGFITYDSSVHFYQISNCDGGQPKQLIVSDISDIFLPLPDGLMVNLEENKPAIRNLLTSLPSLYRESYNTDCALGAALQAAFKILAPRGGRITVFQSCLPNCGPGNLEPRDDGTSHTGDRVQHMAPSIDFYKKLALECSTEQIAVDMFFISSQYLDIATVSGISKYSAGCIHNFSQFNVKSPTIVTRFINCFDRYLSRKIGFEALLRLRCTRGVAIHSFHGNFFVRSSDLLMLPNINPDNAYGMQLSIEDSLDGVSVVCFQAALLYTSSNAERRIRVHTLCIPVTDNLNDVFHNADQQAITCLIAKMAVDRSTEKSLSDAREAFFNAITDSLSAFKLGCSSYSGSGTLLSPLSLKVFPLYILATLKHTAFRTNQPTRLDERMFSMCQMKSLPLYSLIQYIYPDLYPIHSLEEQPKIDYEKLTEIPLPPVLQLSAERVESNGIYLMDDSETLTIFVGSKCSDQLIQKIFGYVNVSSMPEMITTLLEVDSKPSYLLRNFISYIQNFKPFRLPIEIIKDNGPHKLRFYSRLVEDKFESSLSYYEFLQRLSQQVR